MPYPIFTPPVSVNLSPGTSGDYEPRVNEAPFGDGYSQRSGDGINALSIVLNGQFNAITPAEAATVKAFLAERAGYKPFRFQLPGDAGYTQWIAPKWSESYVAKDVRDVSFTLKQNFDP